MYKMVLKPILDFFLLKRKTRFPPYFIGVGEIICHNIAYIFATATWPFVLGILGAFGSTWLVNLALGCTWKLPRTLGKPSRTYLKKSIFK
jgi:hypothetical protein